MRPASDSILSAVERTDVLEDRLTEVLACVAQVNTRFAAALVSMAGLDPRPGERYAVGTQRGTPGGRRVDMEIAAYDGLAAHETHLGGGQGRRRAISPTSFPTMRSRCETPSSASPTGGC